MLTGSKKILLELLKKNGKMPIDEVVEKTGLAKTTIREHLTQLERDGLVDKSYDRSGPGRPGLQFQVSGRGDREFPSKENEMTRELLRYIKKEKGEDLLEEFFQQFWEKRYRDAQSRMNDFSKDDVPGRRNALKQMLEEEGFMPVFESFDNEDEFKIKECNCPFKEIVKETRIPCRLEEEFYKKLFCKEAARTSYIADGDYSCSYSIPVQ